MIDEEVKKIFDDASARCERILTEHGEQLRAIAEYLLEHETMEKEVFDYFFEHGEFPAVDPKLARQARSDSTIERPARKISMTDGYAEEQPALSGETPQNADGAETPAQQTSPPADSSPSDDSDTKEI